MIGAITPVHPPEWIAIERPFPAFALSIPEAADVPASYAVRRHAEGGGRKDIPALGEPDSALPYLRVEISAGSEIIGFDDAKTEIIGNARAFGPTDVNRLDDSLASKFGPFTLVSFIASKGPQRRCLGFVRAYNDPRLQLSGCFAKAARNSSSKAYWPARLTG